MTDQPAGNFYDKYASRNPVIQRLMAGFLNDFDQLTAMSEASSVYEIGCGEGNLAIRLAGKGVTVDHGDEGQEGKKHGKLGSSLFPTGDG